MKRLIRSSCLALAALVFAATVHAQEAAEPAPSPVMYAVAPDLAMTWPNFQDSPIYAAFKQAVDQWMAQPANPQAENLKAALAEWEQELGYALTPEVFFGQIVNAAAVSLAPPSGMGQPTGVLSLSLGDVEKFDALIEKIKTPDASATQPSAELGEETIAGETVMVINPGTEGQAYAVRKGSAFVISNSRGAVEDFLGGTMQLMPPQAVQAMSDLTLPQQDMLLYMDLSSIESIASEYQGSEMDLVPGASNMLIAVTMEPLEWIGEILYQVDPADTSPLAQSMRMPPGKPAGLAYVPQTTWMVSSQNNVDLEAIYDTYAETFTAAGPDAQAQFDMIVAQVEGMLGVSLRNDLLPAFGNDMLFALNNVQINLVMPLGSSADVLLGIAVEDEATVAKALQAMDQMAQNVVAAQFAMMMGGYGAYGQDQGAPAGMPQLVQTEAYGGVEIHTYDVASLLPMLGPGISPSYAIHDGMLLFNISRDNLKKAIDLKGGAAPAMDEHPVLQEFMTRFSIPDANEISYANFAAMSPLATAVKTFMQMQMDASDPEMQIMMDLLTNLGQSLDHAVGTSRYSDDEVSAMSVLKLRQ